MAKEYEEILKQLRITNRLLALMLVSQEDSISKKSIVLLDAGFKPIEVADMLNVPSGTVTKARSRAKGRTKH